MDTPVSEFYAPRAARDLGDPALDPPMTVRVHRGEDRTVRYSPDARRAVRTTSDTEPWVLVTGSGGVGGWLSHGDVQDWPVAHWLVCETAFARHAPSRPAVLQPVERGDMDVDSFRG